MTNINCIDRDVANTVSKAALKAFQNMCKEHNLHVTWKGTRFGRENMTIKFEVALISNSGKIETKDRSDFRLKCRRFGFEPEDLDKFFKFEGEKYKLVGLKTRAYAYPLVATRLRDSRTTRFSTDALKRSMLKDKVPA